MPSLKLQLDQAREYVEQARKRVADQTALIAQLIADGHDPEPAQRLLVAFLEVLDTLTAHLAELERNPPR